MPVLPLTFTLRLIENALPHGRGPYGVRFDRWLPNGIADRIPLPSSEPGTIVAVWFERCGYVDGSFIRWEGGRHEVDPTVMVRQRGVDAGDLCGSVIVEDVPEETCEVVRENRVGHDLYTRLGKRIVTRVLYPAVSNFLQVLRSYHGQHWIPELAKWDSREQSLGAYCSGLNLRWALGGTTGKFVPTELQITIRLRGGSREFITEADWSELRTNIASGLTPSPAADMLRRAHASADHQRWRYALIDAVTALELALSEFVTRTLGNESSLIERLAGFADLSLSAQLVAAAAFSARVSRADLASALNAIQRRNDVVHDGWYPDEQDETVTDQVSADVQALMRVASAFIDGPRFRFPSMYVGSMLVRDRPPPE